MTDPHASSFRDDPRPDHRAQGQAALLLIESLIHTLLDKGALTKTEALDAIRSAEEVKEESVGEGKEPEAVLRKSVQLLTDMRLSIAAHSGRYAPDGRERPAER